MLTHPRENPTEIAKAIREAIDLSDGEVERLLRNPPKGFIQKLSEFEKQYPRQESNLRQTS